MTDFPVLVWDYLDLRTMLQSTRNVYPCAYAVHGTINVPCCPDCHDWRKQLTVSTALHVADVFGSAHIFPMFCPFCEKHWYKPPVSSNERKYNTMTNKTPMSKQAPKSSEMTRNDERIDLDAVQAEYYNRYCAKAVVAAAGNGFSIVDFHVRTIPGKQYNFARATIKFPAGTERKTVFQHASRMLRATFPLVGEISFFKTDDEAEDMTVASWMVWPN